MLQMSAFGHTLLGTYALIGFTVTGLSFLRTWVEHWYKGSLRTLKEQCDHLQQTLHQHQQQIAGLKDLVARTTAERDRQQAEVAQLQAELAQLTSSYAILQDQNQALEAQLAEYRQQVQELEADLAGAQAENEQLRETCDRQRAELEAAYMRTEELEAFCQQQSVALATLEKTYREQGAQLTSCHAHLQERDTVITTLEKELDHLRQQQDQSRVYAQLWAWVSGVMVLVCAVMGLGPWSPLRPIWEAIYPHLPMFY